MDKIMEFFSNPLFAVFLTLFFGILAVILYYRSPSKVIKCLVSSNKLIDIEQTKYSNLTILYSGKKVEKLIVTTVTFWNSSFSTIRKEDLIKKSPFSVTIDDGEILDVSVLNGKDTPNQIGIDSIDSCSMQIYFDYLDHKEGGIIQIIHTGNSKIDISKKLMGGKITKSTNKKIKLKSGIFMIVYTIICSTIIILFYYFDNIELLPKINEMFSILFIMSIICSIFSTFYFDENYVPKNCKKKKKNK